MTRDKRWLYIAILSFIIAIVWVGVTLAIKQRTSTLPPDLDEVVRPLDPTIDRETLAKLEKRKPITGL